jgi:TrmH family RNA methyltransferase
MAVTKGKLKELRALTHKKFRDEEKKFLVEGVKLICDAVDSGFRILEAYYTKDMGDSAAGKQLLQKLAAKTSNVHLITNREMELISETVTFQGIVAVLRQQTYSLDEMVQGNATRSRLVAFDGVADPGNVGTMVRTCDWFGVDGVILGRNSVELYNPKVLRATMGGIFHLPIVEGVDLPLTISRAKSMGYRIYVTELEGETHFDRVSYEGKTMVIFGNEAWGVSDQVSELADYRVSIRRYGQGESLNVSVACGIVLSAMHRLYD